MRTRGLGVHVCFIGASDRGAFAKQTERAYQ